MAVFCITRFNIQKFHRVYLFVLYGWQDKGLFLCTSLTDWFYNRKEVSSARYGLQLWVNLSLFLTADGPCHSPEGVHDEVNFGIRLKHVHES